MHSIVPRLVIMTALLTTLLGLPAAAAPADTPASRAGGDAGDLDVHLAPAIVDVDQQVVVHSTFQLHARPGGAPDGAGRPADLPAPSPEDSDDADESDDTDDTDDTTVAAPSSGAEAAGDAVPSLPQFSQDDDDTGTTTEDPTDESTEESTQEDAATDDAATDDAATDDAATDDELSCEDDAATEDDEATENDDAADDDATDDATQDESLFQEDDVTVADDDVESHCDAGVVFSVDYGDGSTEEMAITKAAGQDGSRRAIARHTYGAEGEYTVTVTATPDEGEAVTTTVTVHVGGGEARLAGGDRVATAVRVSQDTFPENGSASTVLLARADGFADALASAPLALVEDAPVLLTTGQELPDAVVTELTRALEAGGQVTILGGTAAVPQEIEDALTALGHAVERVSGEDRVATALAIAEAVVAAGGDVDEVLLAAADGFADALPAAAHAAANDGIVLLTDGQQLDARVGALLDELDVPVTVMGGEGAVSTGVLDALAARGLPVQRVDGDSRYETAAALAETAGAVSDTVVLATGGDFPDALAGAAHAARRGAPVLLVGDSVPEAVRAYLVANADVIDRIFVLGGDGAVSPEVLDEAQALIGS